MELHFIKRIIQTAISFLLLLLVFISPAIFAENKTVVIIKSSDNIFFNKTIKNLIQLSDPEIRFIEKTVDSINLDKTLLNQSSLIITLGLAATSYCQKIALDIPVIHSYVTELQYSKFKNTLPENHHFILLDQPLERYLSFIKLLTGLENIGIIRNKVNIIQDKTLKELVSNPGIKLRQQVFEKGDNPLNKIKQLLLTSDALLSLPDPNVYNRQTLKGILLTTYRQNKPVISYSPAHVKSGALAAIFASPENIGNQIAGLLDQLLLGGNLKVQSHYYAADFDIKINDRVAKSLALKLTDKNQVLLKLKSESMK